jgi:CHAT domain-containing protein
LKALREFARSSQAQRQYVAFGNPLLEGAPGYDRHESSARRSKRKQTCALTAREQAVVVAQSDAAGPITSVLRGGATDVAAVKQQPPLPDTADEICEAAKSLGATEDDVHLGAAVTEARVKAMSEAGRLKDYRIVHFATHGLVADETETMLNARAEPALVMTPPERPSEEDDGLLTASEVTGLKLDADWVILSACNTAAGEKGNAEALSGLARAFFYAGARALLVSHWYVDSSAGKLLVSKMLSAQRDNPSIGRAEALRISMVDLMMGADAKGAHPAHWAPFVVVGEGAR